MADCRADEDYYSQLHRDHVVSINYLIEYPSTATFGRSKYELDSLSLRALSYVYTS